MKTGNYITLKQVPNSIWDMNDETFYQKVKPFGFTDVEAEEKLEELKYIIECTGKDMSFDKLDWKSIKIEMDEDCHL